MIIDRKSLADALKAVTPALPKVTGMPVLNGVHLHGDTVTATDLDLTIRSTVEVREPHDDPIILPAKRLAAIVGRCLDDTVQLTVEGHQVAIRSGTVRAQLGLIDALEWPRLTRPSGETVTLDADDIAVLRRVVPMASVDESRAALCAVHLEGDVVETTDSYHLARGHLSVTLPSLLVPRRILMAALAESPAQLGITALEGQMVELSTESTTWTTRLVAEEYPNLDRVIPSTEQPVHITADTAELVNAVQTTTVLGTTMDRPVRMATNHGWLEFRRLADGDEVIASVECTGGDIDDVAYNSAYLLGLLQAVTAETTTFQLTDGWKPTLLKDGEWLGLIMPVRVAAA